MNDIRVRVAATLAAFLSLWLLAGIAVSQSDPSPPVFLRAWGGEGEFLRRVEGLAIAPDKTIFAANTILSRITRVDPGNNSMVSWGEVGEGEGKLADQPRGIAMDTAGHIYVVDGTPRVHVFSQEGDFVRSWGVANATSVSDLAMGRDSLYVLGEGTNWVKEYTLDGTLITSFVPYGSSEGTVARASGVAVDQARGFVYVVDDTPTRPRVLKFTVGGEFLLEWGSRPQGPGQMGRPWKASVDSKGNLYVSDLHRNVVNIFSPAGDYVGELSGEGDAGGGFSRPRAVAVDVNPKSDQDPTPRDDVYVADDSYIRRFPGNRFDRSWGREESEYSRPFGIVAGAGDLVYVADRSVPEGNRSWQGLIYDRYGTLRATWPLHPSGQGAGIATGLSQDPSGAIYVAIPGVHTIKKFTFNQSSLASRLEWVLGGTAGVGNDKFNRPLDVANDTAGKVFVADSKNNRIQVLDGSGRYLGTISNPGIGPGQFTEPVSLAFGSNGDLYLFEIGAMRVQRYDSNGLFLNEWGGEGTSEGKFGRPSPGGLSFPTLSTVGERIIVTDPVNHRLQAFTSGGVFISEWGQLASSAGRFGEIMDVSSAPNGEIFLTDVDRSRVHVYSFDVATDVPAARLFANGNMESEPSLTGWAFGTLNIGRALPTTRLPGAAPNGMGNSVMQIGTRVQPPIHQNQKVAWASQVIYVHPDIENPELAFDYRILTNDELAFASLRLEILDALGVNSLAVSDYGYSNCGALNFGKPLDLGWNRMIHDLSPYSGEYIRVQFSIRNAWPDSFGIWAHLDNVTVEPGVERPYQVFAPSAHCR